jgi:hypothetical protein
MDNQIISEFIAKFEEKHNCILDREVTDPMEYDILYINESHRFSGNEIKIKFFIFNKNKTSKKIYVCLRFYQ